jgi:hypothetical protein
MVAAALTHLGVPNREMGPAPYQTWGVVRFVASDDDGELVEVKVHGRDAVDSQLVAKVWHTLWYRETGPAISYSRLQAVEHEALLTVVAKGVGVNVPRLAAVGAASSEIALISFRESGVFTDSEAPEQHDLQYFEMFGNRGIYHRGWSAVTKHKIPWVLVGGQLPAFDDDVWELYDGNSDWSQAKDLSGEMPDKLHELQRLWLIEATKYNAIPLDDRSGERLNSDLAGRPTLIRGDSQLLFENMGRLSESSVLNIKNKSFSITAEVTTPDDGAEGVIIAQGGRFGGWSVYTLGGYLKFTYNVLGLHEFTVSGTEAVPTGQHQVRMEFAYDGGGLAKGGTVTLYHDGKAVGEGRVDLTQPMIFSADETTDIGRETGTTVSSDYTPSSSRFNGRIGWVQIDIGADDNDHYIDDEERLRIAMARQ